jgi:UDP-N-acetyl-D-mannosaminuronic acid dehydrogenase
MERSLMTYKTDVCVVGGAGHVGAPLAIVFAKHGLDTLIYDLNPSAMQLLQGGEMPFMEEGAEPLLKEALAAKKLSFTTDVARVADARYVVVTIGTPIDEFQNPMLRLVEECMQTLLPYLSDGQTVILRSTLFPGVTDWLQRYLRMHGKKTGVAFCPERVVQGHSIRELQELAQIVSGTTPEAEAAAEQLFAKIAPKIVRMVVKEAEFAKLISNAYRYITFATSNQFYMMVTDAGLDYHRLLKGLKEDYPRMADLPSPGFAAGPCLYKDTLQLAAAYSDTFGLGYAALQVNEGLPAFIVQRLAARQDLGDKTVGILGMAFKSQSDDIRSSLSYKLKKLLKYQAREVLATDPFVTVDSTLLPLDEVIKRSDVLVVGVPHKAYKHLETRGKPLVDVWNFVTTEHK